MYRTVVCIVLLGGLGASCSALTAIGLSDEAIRNITARQMNGQEVLEYLGEISKKEAGSSVRTQSECVKDPRIFGTLADEWPFDEGCQRPTSTGPLKRIEIFKGTGGQWTFPTVVGMVTHYEEEGRPFGNTLTHHHGATSDDSLLISLESGEKVTGMAGYTGSTVDSLGFITETVDGNTKVYPMHGGTGGSLFVICKHIVSFHGAASLTNIRGIGVNVME